MSVKAKNFHIKQKKFFINNKKAQFTKMYVQRYRLKKYPNSNTEKLSLSTLSKHNFLYLAIWEYSQKGTSYRADYEEKNTYFIKMELYIDLTCILNN